MTGQFHALTVSAVHPETDDAVSIEFDVPAAISEPFHWRAGQHLTLRFSLHGEDVRRTYSVSDAPVQDSRLRITVKRVKGGLVSNHINDHLKHGATVEVMPPFGSFCLDADATARRTYYFFGAGSGITPLFAMIRAVLAGEPHSVAHLAYGNRHADSIIFRDQLAGLVRAEPERLSVNHALSSPSWWSSFDYWRRGTINAEAVEAFVAAHPPYAQDAQYYICGPGDMNGTVSAALKTLDVPDDRIHAESFGGEIKQDLSLTGVDASATVDIDGRILTVPVAAGQSILDAVRDAGGNPRFSCQSGVCGACRARLKSGEVHLRARMALSDDEIADGAILTCQAVATSAELAVAYD